MAALPVADRWFDRTRVDDVTTVLVEPHVVALMRCNIWYVKGRDRDLIVDTGTGLSSVAGELGDLTGKPVIAVATHGHDDHIGGHHEFGDVRAHRLEAGLLRCPPLRPLSPRQARGEAEVAMLERAGYDMREPLVVTARPAGFAAGSFRQQPCARVSEIGEGDVIDLGDRAFEVLHLPGHSPGSIGLRDSPAGILFSGDAIYDGPLLDELGGSRIDQYCLTMERLMTLPVTVVHAGHDPGFGRDRLRRAQGRGDGGPRYRHHDDIGAAGVPAAAAKRGHLVARLAPQRGKPPADVSRPITTMFIGIPGKAAGYSCSNGWRLPGRSGHDD